MVSTGKFSFKATELSVKAEVTAKADFCGVPTAKGASDGALAHGGQEGGRMQGWESVFSGESLYYRLINVR